MHSSTCPGCNCSGSVDLNLRVTYSNSSHLIVMKYTIHATKSVNQFIFIVCEHGFVHAFIVHIYVAHKSYDQSVTLVSRYLKYYYITINIIHSKIVHNKCFENNIFVKKIDKM